jgi:tetratricopeptide (TPR) repeat protein
MTPQSRTEPGLPSGNRKRAAQALADQALHGRRKAELLDLARRALELDGECTDAQVLLAREEAASPKDLAARLKIIVDRAEAKLGAPFLHEHRAQLWDIPEARPYLKARLALAIAHEKSGRPALAIPHLEELLKIDGQDHQGVRFRLVCCLLAANDMKSLTAALKRWEGESSAFMAWAALLERIRSKSEKGAEKALLHARRINPYFEEYLTGRRMLPKQIPARSDPGSPAEAALAIRLFGETWANDREGMYWLFKHG